MRTFPCGPKIEDIFGLAYFILLLSTLSNLLYSFYKIQFPTTIVYPLYYRLFMSFIQFIHVILQFLWTMVYGVYNQAFIAVYSLNFLLQFIPKFLYKKRRHHGIIIKIKKHHHGINVKKKILSWHYCKEKKHYDNGMKFFLL